MILMVFSNCNNSNDSKMVSECRAENGAVAVELWSGWDAGNDCSWAVKRSDDVLCRLHLLNQWLKEKEAGVKRRERNMPSMHKDFLLIRLFFSVLIQYKLKASQKILQKTKRLKEAYWGVREGPRAGPAAWDRGGAALSESQCRILSLVLPRSWGAAQWVGSSLLCGESLSQLSAVEYRPGAEKPFLI